MKNQTRAVTFPEGFLDCCSYLDMKIQNKRQKFYKNLISVYILSYIEEADLYLLFPSIDKERYIKIINSMRELEITDITTSEMIITMVGNFIVIAEDILNELNISFEEKEDLDHIINNCYGDIYTYKYTNQYYNQNKNLLNNNQQIEFLEQLLKLQDMGELAKYKLIIFKEEYGKKYPFLFCRV